MANRMITCMMTSHDPESQVKVMTRVNSSASRFLELNAVTKFRLMDPLNKDALRCV